METKRYVEEDFKDFIKELVDNKKLNDTAEEGIAKLVMDKGFDSLTEKQKFVFQNAITQYIYDECKRCGLEIPWTEMSAAEDNGSLCSWCQQLSRNDKD